MKYIYLCEDSAEGIFSAIYDAWDSHHGHNNNEIQVCTDNYNCELFSEYIDVKTDITKAKKVADTIRRKVSPQIYTTFMYTAASFDTTKADTIYRVMILALHMGPSVLDHLADANVAHITELSRHVGNEIYHYKEFLRFQELSGGILFGKIRPKCDVLPFMAPHFADRLPSENFIIADTGRRSIIFHAKESPVSYTHMKDFDLDSITGELSIGEERLQSLFKQYTKTITIESRENKKLQRQMLPLHFREYMTEFMPEQNSSASRN